MRMPELSKAPGYDETDNDNPYVAFASFNAFMESDKTRLLEFLRVSDEIYTNTADPRVINLIKLEIFDSFRDYIPKVMHEVFSEKTRSAFLVDQKDWESKRGE